MYANTYGIGTNQWHKHFSEGQRVKQTVDVTDDWIVRKIKIIFDVVLVVNSKCDTETMQYYFQHTVTRWSSHLKGR